MSVTLSDSFSWRSSAFAIRSFSGSGSERGGFLVAISREYTTSVAAAVSPAQVDSVNCSVTPASCVSRLGGSTVLRTQPAPSPKQCGRLSYSSPNLIPKSMSGRRIYLRAGLLLQSRINQHLGDYRTDETTL